MVQFHFFKEKMLDVAAVLTSAFNPIVGQAVGHVGEDRKIR